MKLVKDFGIQQWQRTHFTKKTWCLQQLMLKAFSLQNIPFRAAYDRVFKRQGFNYAYNEFNQFESYAK